VEYILSGKLFLPAMYKENGEAQIKVPSIFITVTLGDKQQ
jgi:hypothetical protein